MDLLTLCTNEYFRMLHIFYKVIDLTGMDQWFIPLKIYDDVTIKVTCDFRYPVSA